MKTTTLTIPEVGLIAVTRAMLGAGLALLISKRLTSEQRETAGVVLTAVGVLTTFPLVLEVFGKSQTRESATSQSSRSSSEDADMPRMAAT